VTTTRILPIVAALLSVATAAYADHALSPTALQEIGQVEAEIDRIETATLERLPNPPDNQVQQLELLGKSMLYDKQLSVNRNEACAFCHMPETGFTGPVYRVECDDRRISWIGTHAIQQPQAADAQLCRAVACAALQSGPGRSRWR
jgi:cytochrome c peroxidase